MSKYRSVLFASVAVMGLVAAPALTLADDFYKGKIFQPEKIQLDFRKYAWVGVVTPDFRVCYGFGPKGVKSWDDMMHRKEFVLGATARGSGAYINAATMREVFHAPIKQIMGFPGSAEVRLAILRG